MYYLIQNKTGQTIDSNIENQFLIEELSSCIVPCERVFCSNKKRFRRQGFFKTQNLNYYLCSYDNDITNKIFKHYLHAFEFLSNQIDVNIQLVKIKESQKTRRLKHNLITHCTNILQELYKTFPQDSFKNGCNHLENIENFLKKEPRKGAYTFLKILKNSNLMKAEFDVYEMLDSDSPYVDFSQHPIHKVLILTLNPFWLDLMEQRVSINIDNFFETANIDYRSIAVVFSHIFDNITKYIMPYSELNIHFNNNPDHVEVIIEMNSLKVEEQEVEKIFQENYSGIWANHLALQGNGIGMFVVKKLTELNKGKIYFQTNVDKKPILLEGVPYEKNRILIELRK